MLLYDGLGLTKQYLSLISTHRDRVAEALEGVETPDPMEQMFASSPLKIDPKSEYVNNSGGGGGGGGGSGGGYLLLFTAGESTDSFLFSSLPLPSFPSCYRLFLFSSFLFLFTHPITLLHESSQSCASFLLPLSLPPPVSSSASSSPCFILCFLLFSHFPAQSGWRHCRIRC